MPSLSKVLKLANAPQPTSKDRFDEQDLIDARSAIRDIKPQPSFTRKQFINALQADFLDALIRGASTSQLKEALSKLSVPLASSALVNLQRLARKRAGPALSTSGPPVAALSECCAPAAGARHSGSTVMVGIPPADVLPLVS